MSAPSPSSPRTAPPSDPSYARLAMPALLTSQPDNFPPTPATVTGRIPPFLCGKLMRNGPSQWELGDSRLLHWFDGFAAIHAFEMDGQGGVLFSKRFLDSASYTHAVSQGRITIGDFGTPPSPTLGGRVLNLLKTAVGAAPRPHNPNVSVQVMQGRWLAMTETPQAVAFDPASLRTLHILSMYASQSGQQPFSDSITCHMATAHPLYDDTANKAYNVGVRFGPQPAYVIYHTPLDAAAAVAQLGASAPAHPCPVTRTLLCQVPTRRPCYMHSFAMSAAYIVLTETPVYIDVLHLLASPVTGATISDSFSTDANGGSCFIVVNKITGNVVGRFPTERPFYTYHHVNAWEEVLADGCSVLLHVDAVVYDEPIGAGGYDEFTLQKLRSNEFGAFRPGFFTRFSLPLASAAPPAPLTPTRLCSVAVEFPRMNALQHGRQYRFAYAALQQAGAVASSGLIKMRAECDSAGGAGDGSVVWSEQGVWCGEPLFVANGVAGEEDDGCVLCICYDAAQERSFLLVLQATSMTELARAYSPVTIPLGLHALYADAATSTLA